VKYRVDEPHSQVFAVDPDRGIISTKVALDKQQLASVSFSVIAYDLGVPPRSSTATVRLLVRENPASLMFDEPAYSFVVFENQSPHTEVGQVTAVFDPPSIRYDLFPESSEADFVDAAFEMNSTTGKIYTKVITSFCRNYCYDTSLLNVA